ncbi:type II secretion system F family protein [bacterium]|nr:type II secretion system F family protein [bacterium]
MLTYQYEARDAAGQRVKGTMVAATEREVVQAMGDRGLLPIRIDAARQSAPVFAGLKRKKPPNGLVMARVYRQLSDLLKAGVSLLRAIEIIEKQSEAGMLPEALADVRKAVADGEGLATSLGKHPQVFDELAVSMIRAGEEGGFLEDVLSRIADYTEREAELRGKVMGAMAYPMFLSIIGVLVVSGLLVFFVPKFEKMFNKLRAKGQLPSITEWLLNTSYFMQTYGIFLLVGLIAGGYVLLRWLKTPSGRIWFDKVRISVPKLGSIIRSFAIVRFSRVLGTMLANGIPLLTALRIAKDSTGNVVLSEAISRAADNVTTGASLADPLRASGLFPRDVIEMVAVAEESNTLEKVLVDIADSTERRTTQQLDLFVRLLEPMMLLIMAAVVMAIVAALLLPIMKMSSTLK